MGAIDDPRRIELGPALRSLAASAAPASPRLRSAAAESARRSASARFRANGLVAAAALALILPGTCLGLRAAYPSRPVLATASDDELASEFAAAILGSPEEEPASLGAELESYIVALWR